MKLSLHKRLPHPTELLNKVPNEILVKPDFERRTYYLKSRKIQDPDYICRVKVLVADTGYSDVRWRISLKTLLILFPAGKHDLYIWQDADMPMPSVQGCTSAFTVTGTRLQR